MENLLDVQLEDEEKFVKNSSLIKTKKGVKYSASTQFMGIKGTIFSGYFGVIFLDDNQKEVARSIQWLNDFTNAKKETKIIFESITNQIVLIYRINEETQRKSICFYKLKPIEQVQLLEVDERMEESFNGKGKGILQRPKELTSEQELDLEKKMVWLFGHARSGTTWLGTQLLSHNTWSINEFQLGRHLGSIWQTHDSTIERDFDNFKDTHDYFFSLTFQNTWNYYIRKLILNRTFAQFEDITRNIIVKDPSSSIVSDLITDCVPNSKIIFLIRDGRDVVDSGVDAFKEGSWMNEAGYSPKHITDRNTVIEVLSLSWVKHNQIMINAFEKHHKDLRYKVRYEELRKNTLGEIRKIYNFLKIDVNDEDLEKIESKFRFENIPKELKGSGKFYRSAKPGKWKENFSKDEISLMHKIMKPMLTNLGYL